MVETIDVRASTLDDINFYNRDDLILEGLEDLEKEIDNYNTQLDADDPLMIDQHSNLTGIDNDVLMNDNQDHHQILRNNSIQNPTLTITRVNNEVQNVPTMMNTNKRFGNIIDYNGDNGYIDTPPIHKRPFNYEQYGGGNPRNELLNNISWDFGLNENNNGNSPYAESLTLGSDSRTSNEFFARTSNELFSRDSTEFFDSSLTNVDSLEQVESRKSRFANSISNSISSIFKNDSKPSRFNLRGINPLSTHKDPLLVQTLPNNLVDNVENLAIDGTTTFKTDRHIQTLKPNDFVVKKKRSTTNSILNSLTNARLGFNTNKEKKPLSETVIKEETDLEDLQSSRIEYNEELEMVISLASRNSSTYNFNSPRTSTDTRYTDALQHQPIFEEMPITIKQEVDEDNINIKQEEDKLSPDYAALFSNVTAPKKRSKTLSFKMISLSSQPQQTIEDDDDDLDNNDQVEDKDNDQQSQQDTANSVKKERIKEYPSISEDGSIQIIPMRESTRGRKPSLEYDATKTFVCTTCSRRFRRQEHLKRHFRSIHTNQKPFDCPLCNKKFSRSDNLTQHIKTHEREE